MPSVQDSINVKPSDKIENNKAVFIWLDILAWGKLLDDDQEYENLLRKLTQFQELFKNDYDYNTDIISDGIILQIKTKISEEFKKILIDIGKKQFKFINEHKLFIRGGIAVGTRFERTEHPNGLYVSNGLAKAVKIEEKHIDWPVIGTDEEKIKELQEYFKITDENEYFGLIRSLNKKGKNVYFIDFLEEKDEYNQLLKKNVAVNKEKPKIQNKYIWLLRYYRNRYGDDDLGIMIDRMVS